MLEMNKNEMKRNCNNNNINNLNITLTKFYDIKNAQVNAELTHTTHICVRLLYAAHRMSAVYKLNITNMDDSFFYIYIYLFFSIIINYYYN